MVELILFGITALEKYIFHCCWRESASNLQFDYGCLPLSYLTDQQTVLFINVCIEVTITYCAVCLIIWFEETHSYSNAN